MPHNSTKRKYEKGSGKFGGSANQLHGSSSQHEQHTGYSSFFLNSCSAWFGFNLVLQVMPESGKSLCNNLPVIRIQGDGRCLFRSVVYGACLRKGQPSPSLNRQKELADELRAKVVDEFIKRRADTEWFLEGDFETYTVRMRKPHIWGGEPELLMSSHVLRMPITVVMDDKKSSSLKVIAEYGQEYGKDNPIRVIYDGYGHYDALKTSD